MGTQRPQGRAAVSGRVYVYRNLNTGTWSVRALDGPRRGLVIAHPAEVVLRDAAFLVSAAGRARVLRTGVRNVHAGVAGYVAPRSRLTAAEAFVAVTYNPRRNATFVSVPSGAPVARAALVHFPAQPRRGSVPLRAWGAA